MKRIVKCNVKMIGTLFLTIRQIKSSSNFLKKYSSQTFWYIAVIPALRRLKQEDLKFEAILGYIVRSHLKKTNNNYIYIHTYMYIYVYILIIILPI
jgi:hypothetical protein